MLFLKKLQQISIKKRLLSLLFINIFSLLALGGTGIYFTMKLKEKILTYSEISDNSREIQVSFKKQVHEWKNILLRGDSEFVKYKESFFKESVKVDLLLKKLESRLDDLTLKKEVRELILEKERLMKIYEEGLLLFDPLNSFITSKLIDKKVKGIDRKFIDEVDKIVTETKKFELEESEKIILRSLWLTFILLFFGIFYSFIINYFIFKSIHKPIEYSKSIVTQIANGDLSKRAEVTGFDEISNLQKSINEMADSISNLLEIIKHSIEINYNSTEELNNLADTYQKISESIGTSVQNEIELLKELMKTADNTDLSTTEIKKSILSVNEKIELMFLKQERFKNQLEILSKGNHKSNNEIISGKSIVQNLISFISSTEESFKRISRVTSLIQNISKETNLLSLNASIEAARAGSAGLGFSVVAENISRLAFESMNQVNEIKSSVNITKDAINNAVNASLEVRVLFQSLLESSTKNEEIVNNFQEVMYEQNEAINHIDSVVHQFNVVINSLQDDLQIERKLITSIGKETDKNSDSSKFTNENSIKVRTLVSNLLTEIKNTSSTLDKYKNL